MRGRVGAPPPPGWASPAWGRGLPPPLAFPLGCCEGCGLAWAGAVGGGERLDGGHRGDPGEGL